MNERQGADRRLDRPRPPPSRIDALSRVFICWMMPNGADDPSPPPSAGRTARATDGAGPKFAAVPAAVSILHSKRLCLPHKRQDNNPAGEPNKGDAHRVFRSGRPAVTMRGLGLARARAADPAHAVWEARGQTGRRGGQPGCVRRWFERRSGWCVGGAKTMNRSGTFGSRWCTHQLRTGGWCVASTDAGRFAGAAGVIWPVKRCAESGACVPRVGEPFAGCSNGHADGRHWRLAKAPAGLGALDHGTGVSADETGSRGAPTCTRAASLAPWPSGGRRGCG